MEPTMVALTDQVTPAATTGDAQLDLSGRAYAANAASSILRIGSADPALVQRQGARGNTAVATGFDQRPATDLGHAPRGDFASPFARAMSAYSAG